MVFFKFVRLKHNPAGKLEMEINCSREVATKFRLGGSGCSNCDVKVLMTSLLLNKSAKILVEGGGPPKQRCNLFKLDLHPFVPQNHPS